MSEERTCSVSECRRSVLARGLCSKHYSRWYRTGSTERVLRERGPICVAGGCNRPHQARGYCAAHYERFRRSGSLESVQERRPGCLVPGCEGAHRGQGYCDKHLRRFKRYGDPLGGGVFRSRLPERCAIDGCEDRPVAREMCAKHYGRWRKHGDPAKTAFERGRNARDEWHASRSGYIWRYAPGDANASPNGYVYQHRHVASELIGRPLRKGENVHHINGIKDDNRPENLEIWVSSQPAGQRRSDLVAWACEILKEYGHDVIVHEANKAPRSGFLGDERCRALKARIQFLLLMENKGFRELVRGPDSEKAA